MQVAWTRPALQDLSDIQDYIAEDSPAAAFNLVNAIIDRTEAFLGSNSMAGRIGRVRGTRELVFPDLPYILVYRETDRIEILAVVHTARDWPASFS